METRAHFVLIGLFTILGIIGGLGFFLWLASVQIDRQYAGYGVLFDDVSGPNQSADVSFNGVGVGRVVGIRIWENDPSKVFVEIEIDATTPVAIDTMAQLESQGVTGVAYIALSGGSPGAARLEPPAVGLLPIIPSRQSSLRSLVDSAPDLLGDASVLIKQLEGITGAENQQALTQVLRNIESATGNLDRVLTEFSDVLSTAQTAADDIAGFTATLDVIGTDTRTTLATADSAFETLSQTLDATAPAIASIDALVTNDLSPLADSMRNTLTTTDEAFGRMDTAFATAQDLLSTDFDPVVADVRRAMADFADVIATAQADLPAVMTDLRATTTDARAAIATALPGLRDFGQLGGEARGLVRSINDLVRQLSRAPSQLLRDNRVPDYRR